MRREVDRNVRVAECASEAEARSKLEEARCRYPNEDTWIDGELHKPPAPARPDPDPPEPKVVAPPPTEFPRVRVASPWQRTHPRDVTWRETWREVRRGDLGVPIVMLVAGAVCAILSTVPHEPQWPLRHAASLDHLAAIAIMWFGLACANAAYKLVSTWWSLRRIAATAARARWSRGDMIGMAVLTVWITAQLTTI